nr:parA protein - Escherichia coli plasmid R1 [Escherichia coli]
MMDKRRTIAFKLNPDVNQTDKIVCDTLDSTRKGNEAALTGRTDGRSGLIQTRSPDPFPFM